jgi:peptide/nickel transport system permease protein
MRLRPSRPLVIFLARRFASAVIIILALSFIIFLVFSLTLGDPTPIILGYGWTPEAGKELRRVLGLDDPLHIQYARFLWNALHGDLGRSYVSKLPVVAEVIRALGASIQLAGSALAISLGVAIPLGVLAAVRRLSWVDKVSRILTVTYSSVPVFILGLIMMYIFSVQLRVFPTTGRGGPEYFILPALTLSSYSIVGLFRMTRASMLDVLRKDFVVFAIAKGLNKRSVIYKHAFRNALNPILTLTGNYLGVMIGSAVITEVVFAWPGIGTLLITSILTRDIPMIMGGMLTVATIYVILNTVIDIAYVLLDPRVKVT